MSSPLLVFLSEKMVRAKISKVFGLDFYILLKSSSWFIIKNKVRGEELLHQPPLLPKSSFQLVSKISKLKKKEKKSLREPRPSLQRRRMDMVIGL